MSEEKMNMVWNHIDGLEKALRERDDDVDKKLTELDKFNQKTLETFLEFQKIAIEKINELDIQQQRIETELGKRIEAIESVLREYFEKHELHYYAKKLGSEKEINHNEAKAESKGNKKLEKKWAIDDGRCDCIYRTNCDEIIELCNPKCQDYKKEQPTDNDLHPSWNKTKIIYKEEINEIKKEAYSEFIEGFDKAKENIIKKEREKVTNKELYFFTLKEMNELREKWQKRLEAMQK